MGDTFNKDETTGSAILESHTPTTPSVEIASAAALPRPSFSQMLRGDLGFLPVLLTLVIVAIFFGVTTQGVFFYPRNISNLVVQISTIATLSVGVTLV